MAHGHIAHIEIPSDDLERAKSFYGGVFGWGIDPVEGFPDYEIVSTGQDAIGGAIGLRDKTAPGAMRVYINVDSIETALAEATDLGGSVVVEKTAVPGMGHYAAVKDTEGNEIGLWETACLTGRTDAMARPNPEGLRLVDSHAHLQSERFAGDADDVLSAAYAGGVERLLIPAWNLASTRSGLAFVRRHGLRTSAGIHPHEASGADEPTWEAVRELAVEPDVVAIGETGLDYDRGFSPRDDQLTNLRRHIVLSLDTGKPLILHCRSKMGERDAQDDLIDELRAAGVGAASWRERFGERPPAVLHSFSGPVDYAEAALELGLAVSFSGLAFRKGEEASAEAVRLVPSERLLVETDSPFLKPRGLRGKRNEPANVGVTAAWARSLRGDEAAAFGASLVAAFDRFIWTPA